MVRGRSIQRSQKHLKQSALKQQLTNVAKLFVLNLCGSPGYIFDNEISHILLVDLKLKMFSNSQKMKMQRQLFSYFLKNSCSEIFLSERFSNASPTTESFLSITTDLQTGVLLKTTQLQVLSKGLFRKNLQNNYI